MNTKCLWVSFINTFHQSKCPQSYKARTFPKWKLTRKVFENGLVNHDTMVHPESNRDTAIRGKESGARVIWWLCWVADRHLRRYEYDTTPFPSPSLEALVPSTLPSPPSYSPPSLLSVFLPFFYVHREVLFMESPPNCSIPCPSIKLKSWVIIIFTSKLKRLKKRIKEAWGPA